MKKAALLLFVIFLFSDGQTWAQEPVSHYLDSVIKKSSGVRDYTVDVNAHFEMEALKTRDMQGKLFFKTPDKMKIESKGIFFLPKEVGYLNPALFKPEDFELKFLEEFMYEGGKAVKLQLTPKEIKRQSNIFILTIDTDRSLIREIEIYPLGKGEIKAAQAKITYGHSGEFELPSQIDLQLDLPLTEHHGMGEFGESARKSKETTGKVKLSFSNYIVNSGLTNEMFQQTEVKDQGRGSE